MSQRIKHITSELGDIDAQTLTCDYCQLEVVEGSQNNWIQTQSYGSIGPGISVWQQPKHFCSIEHLVPYFQGATPNV